MLNVLCILIILFGGYIYIYVYIYIYKRFYLFFRERGREGDGGSETLLCERNIHWLPLARPLMGDLA